MYLKKVFLDKIKITDSVPVLKKKDPYDKMNYKPIDLPIISKIYGTFRCDQTERWRNRSYRQNYVDLEKVTLQLLSDWERC